MKISSLLLTLLLSFSVFGQTREELIEEFMKERRKMMQQMLKLFNDDFESDFFNDDFDPFSQMNSFSNRAIKKIDREKLLILRSYLNE